MTISLSPSELNQQEMYLLLRDSVIPRPIAWVSTIGKDGVSNLAPFSFFNIVCSYPPVLGFSCGTRSDDHRDVKWIPKDTYTNIQTNGEFVVNIVPEALMDEMVKSAADLPPGQSEFRFAGLTEAVSQAVRPPRVLGAPVSYECKLYGIVDAGTDKWIMGSIVHVQIDESVYVGRRGEHDHRIDLLKRTETRPVGRLGRAYYARLRDILTQMRSEHGVND